MYRPPLRSRRGSSPASDDAEGGSRSGEDDEDELEHETDEEARGGGAGQGAAAREGAVT